MSLEPLDAELAKCESWEALNENIKGLTDNEHFHQLKNKGVGQTTLLTDGLKSTNCQ